MTPLRSTLERYSPPYLLHQPGKRFRKANKSGRTIFVKKLFKLVAPGAAILLAALALLRLQDLPEPLVPFIRVYPYAVFAAGLFLGWFFVRSRIVFVILLLALADRALLQYAAGGAAAGQIGPVVFNTAAILLPLNLVAFAAITDRGILTLRSLVLFVPVVLQVLLVVWISRPEQHALTPWLKYAVIDPQLLTWTQIPQPAVFAFALAFVLQAIQFFRNRNAIEIAFVWSLTAAFLAFSSGSIGWLSTNYFATAGLILVVALLQTSYRMAYFDELTELQGRRAFNEELSRLGSRFTIALVDVDHFKKCNDTYGHDVGDQVLRMVAFKLSRVAGGGKAYRYGGEEFAVLFAGKSVEEARPYVENLRKAVEETSFVLRGRGRPRKKPKKPKANKKSRRALSVTVSIGLAERNDRNQDSGQVIKAADKALYSAKEAGRNRVKW